MKKKTKKHHTFKKKFMKKCCTHLTTIFLVMILEIDIFFGGRGAKQIL